MRHAPVPHDGAARRRDLAGLTPDERARVERAPAPDRPAVATVLLLARVVVAEACGVDAADVRVDRRCPRCGSTAHGVPRVVLPGDAPAPHLSLSRSRDLVVVAVADVPVGVDVEPVTATPPAPGVVLAAGEPPVPGPHGLLRTWVHKEALLKAAGTGLAVDPRDLRATPPPPGWRVRDVPVPPTHLAALATPDPA